MVGVFMWKCQCGEQIEDQFDACWRCSGRAAGAEDLQNTKEPLPIECPRCRTGLEYLGKKRFHEGGHLTHILLGDLFVNREEFELYACSQCGHVEFFLEGVRDELRSKNILETDSAGDEQNPVSE
jgi:predicted nucleic-acid-binding Zn-ribbon protein